MEDKSLVENGAAGEARPPSPPKSRSARQIRLELLEVDHEDIKCGLGGWSPPGLQFFARKEVYLLLYSVVGVILGSFFTYMVSVISTIEKRFHLNSKQTGFMLAGNDVSQVMLSVVVAYYGNYGNRPRWMATGVLSAAMSCFTAALPHLFYGAGSDAEHTVLTNVLGSNVTDSAMELCPHTVPPTTTMPPSASTLVPVLLFFLSQFFLGLSVSTFHSLGIVYLDDNIDKRQTPIYYGLSMMVRVLGPVSGFLLGSQCLKLWIEPSETPDISMRDPRWLGAWWLGFLILGVCLLVMGCVLFLFPRQLPQSLAKKVEKLERTAMAKQHTDKLLDLQHYIDITKKQKQGEKPSIGKLPAALRRLATNKVWLGNGINTTLYLLALAGYWSFKPKYLETQFHKSASEANLITGMAGLVATVVGLMLGGVVIHWKRPRARIVTGYNIFLSLGGAAAFFVLVYVGCPPVDIRGVNEDCALDCGCSATFAPVCSSLGDTYYSPCVAGCSEGHKNGSSTVFSDCACLGAPWEDNYWEGDASSPGTGLTATAGYCDQDCESFLTYIIVETSIKMIGATGRVGGTLVYLRSVEEQDKALAIGVLTVVMSLFAFIPGPIIMGAIVDSSCLIWEDTSAGRGNCWLYDTDKMRVAMHVFAGTMILLSTLGDIMVFRNSKTLYLYGEQDPEDDEEECKDGEGKEGVNLASI